MNRDEVMSKPETDAKPAKAAPDPFANTPWTIDIDVWLEREGSDPPFRLETYLGRNRNGDIIFENHRRDGFIINFNLRDPYNTGYLFPADKDEALYSAAGAACPSAKGQWGPFKAESVTNGNRTLVVRNLNNGKQIFGYAMQVTKTGGRPFLLLDPGGDNQNGSSS
jgi:hypothetical protein